MTVEGRQRAALFDNRADAAKPLQQSSERLWRFENDGRAGFRNQGCIAAELNRVSQPLLGMEQYCLALQRLSTQPKRLMEISLGRFPLICLPSPFVKLKACFEVAFEQ